MLLPAGLIPELADIKAIDATTSACLLAFRFLPLKALPKVVRPEMVSLSDIIGLRTDSAAALAVFSATSSLPPDIKIDLAATIAVWVARDINSASAAFELVLLIALILEPLLIPKLPPKPSFGTTILT
jgi:hypothetical protein